MRETGPERRRLGRIVRRAAAWSLKLISARTSDEDSSQLSSSPRAAQECAGDRRRPPTPATARRRQLGAGAADSAPPVARTRPQAERQKFGRVLRQLDVLPCMLVCDYVSRDDLDL
eukprot:scaffold3424_cov256-Pinguiococcus_pyrenoidosus.AAC.14